jgi:hypothetical protein
LLSVGSQYDVEHFSAVLLDLGFVEGGGAQSALETLHVDDRVRSSACDVLLLVWREPVSVLFG